MYGIHHHHGPVCGGPVHVGPRPHHGPMCGPSLFAPRPMPHHGPHGFHRAHADSHAAKTVVGGGLGATIGGVVGGPVGAVVGGAIGALVGNASCKWC